MIDRRLENQTNNRHNPSLGQGTNLAQLKQELIELNSKILEEQRTIESNNYASRNDENQDPAQGNKKTLLKNLNLRIKEPKFAGKEILSAASTPSNEISYKILNEILNSQEKNRPFVAQRVQAKGSESRKAEKPGTVDMLLDNELGKMTLVENKELKEIQSKLSEMNRIYNHQSQILEKKKKEYEASLGESKRQNDVLRNEYLVAKKRLEEIQSRKSYARNKMEIEECKFRLKELRAEIETYNSELSNVDQTIKKKEEELLSKEKRFKDEFDGQIKQFEDALATIQDQKQGILSKLNDAIAVYNQTLEQKAMLKEDLNARLIQRAELVGQREELDEFHTNMVQNHKVEIEFFLEERRLLDDLKELNNFYLATQQKKARILHQLEKGHSEFKDMSSTLKNNKEDLDRYENSILARANLLELKDFESFFGELSKNYKSFLEKSAYKEEEAGLTHKFKSREFAILDTLSQMTARTRENSSDEVNRLNLELDEHKFRYESKKEDLKKWREEITALHNRTERVREIDEIESKERFLVKFRSHLERRNLKDNDIKDMERLVVRFLDFLERHEYLSNYCQFLLKISEAENISLQTKYNDYERMDPSTLEEEVANLDCELTANLHKKKKIEQLIASKRDMLEKSVSFEAEEALQAYVQQQMGSGENSHRLHYGSESVEKLKREHRSEFLTLTRQNQEKRIEKYFQAQKEIRNLDAAIDNNIKSVDQTILPLLRKNATCFTDAKALVNALKKQQITLLETEDEVAGQIETILQARAGKIKLVEEKFSKSQSLAQMREAKNYLLKKRKTAEQEISQIENILIDFDKSSSGTTLEEKKLMKDVQILTEKLNYLRDHGGDMLLAEEIKELESELRRTRKRVEDLEMQRIVLEQRFVEQNYLSDDGFQQNFTGSFVMNEKASESQESLNEELEILNLKIEDKENMGSLPIGKSSKGIHVGANVEISPIKGDPNSPEAKFVKKIPNPHPLRSSNNTNIEGYTGLAVKSPRNRTGSKSEQPGSKPQSRSTKELQEMNQKVSRKQVERQFDGLGPKVHSPTNSSGYPPLPSDRFNKFNERVPLPATRTASQDANTFKKSINSDLSSPKAITININNLTARNEESKDLFFTHLQTKVQAQTTKAQPTNKFIMLPRSVNTSQMADQRLDAIGEKPVALEASLEDIRQIVNVHHRVEKLPKNFSITPETMTNKILELNNTIKRSRSVEQGLKNFHFPFENRRSPNKQPGSMPGSNDVSYKHDSVATQKLSKDYQGSSMKDIREIQNGRFNLDNFTLQDFTFADAIKPLLEGRYLYKKFTSYQSLKKAAFDPLFADQNPPENCGYGVRSLRLNNELDKIEIRNTIKNGVESVVLICTILRPVVPQLTLDILKIQKRNFDGSHFNVAQSKITDNISTKALLMQRGPNTNGLNIERYLNCNYYPFSVLLEKGGRIDFVAANYTVFKEWINGINAIMRYKRYLDKMKNKVENLY